MIWALILRHWRALSILAAVAVIAIGMATWRASVYRSGVTAGRAQCEAAHTAALERARAAQAERDREYREGLAEREARIVELSQPIPAPDPRVLVREVIRDVPGDCRCPAVDPAFRVRWSEISDRAREIAAGAVPR